MRPNKYIIFRENVLKKLFQVLEKQPSIFQHRRMDYFSSTRIKEQPKCWLKNSGLRATRKNPILPINFISIIIQ